ncbi:hypothetical protein MHU86_16960 [Fragilaria crotonensis]|nr:hypothetical protein MHU86_16960 [Fragilaria crotonensis]
MTDSPSRKDVDYGETIEVDGKGKAISPPTKTRERRKLITDDEEEEPMSVEDKLQIYLALSIMFIILFGIFFLSWWFFGSAVFKAALKKHNVQLDPAAPPSPTAAPSSSCTRVQEVLSYLGLFPC